MMEKLYIANTQNTPLIDFDPARGVLEIGGKSYSADPALFYKPILEWIDAYVAKYPNTPSVFNVKLEQFDDESTKILLYIFQKLGRLRNFEVNWFYKDIHVLEMGEDLSYMGGTHFNFVHTH